MTDSSHIQSTRHSGVLHLQINRPDKKNALLEAMYHKLSDEVKAADEDASIGAIVLSGAGSCFTAGNDLHDFRERAQSESPRPSAGMRFIEHLMACETPVVAAVKGISIGIGTTLLMHCDFVLAGRSAVFRTPFVDLGLCPEAASSFLMPLVLGYRKASELLLLGEALDAEAALQCDLVNKVVDDAELEREALALAQALASKPQASLRLTKTLLRRAWAEQVRAALELEKAQFAERLKSPECQAAIGRFIERKG